MKKSGTVKFILILIGIVSAVAAAVTAYLVITEKKKKDDKDKKKEDGKGVTSPDGETNFHTGRWALAGDPGSDE